MSGLSFLKLMIMTERIKMMQIPYLDIWSMSQQVLHTSYSSHLFWILKDPVCASSNTVLEENNLPPIMYWFFHKLISMQDVWHMLQLNVVRQLYVITLSSCTSEISSTYDEGAELIRQFPFSIDLNKILPVVRTKAEKPDIHFSQNTST